MENLTLLDITDRTGWLDEARTLNFTIVPYSYIWTPPVIQRVTTLLTLMLLGVIGNSVVIGILTCSRGRWRSRVNIYIINLAIGDLTVCLITMSGELVFEIFGEWRLGNVACKLITYSEIVALSSTTFLLVVMSWDRYVVICHPFSSIVPLCKAHNMIKLVWLSSFIMGLPYLLIFQQVLEGYHPDGEAVYSCKSSGYSAQWQRKAMFSWITIYILLIPSVFVTFCYVSIVQTVFKQGQDFREIDGNTTLRKITVDLQALPKAKLKSIKITLLIVVTFMVCWTPYFLIHNIRIWSDYRIQIPKSVIVLSETLSLVNSVLNPLLYGCINLRLKQGLSQSCCHLPTKDRFSGPSAATVSA